MSAEFLPMLQNSGTGHDPGASRVLYNSTTQATPSGDGESEENFLQEVTPELGFEG